MAELDQIPQHVYQNIYAKLVNERELYKAKHIHSQDTLRDIVNQIVTSDTVTLDSIKQQALTGISGSYEEVPRETLGLWLYILGLISGMVYLVLGKEVYLWLTK